MAEWAKRAVAKIRENEETAKQQTVKFNTEQQLKREQGLLLWNAIRQWLADNCDAFNLEVGEQRLAIETTPSNHVRISYRNGSNLLDASYDDKTLLLTWGTANKCSGNYIADIKDGKVSFFEGDMGRTVDHIGSSMLNRLVGTNI